MTANSPLQSIHKKGLFGDHHKKDENKLLNITELKNLTIVQIYKFKNSKVELKGLNIDDLEISLQNLKVISNKNTRILWSSPNTWLVVSKSEDIIEIINEKFDDKDFAITDISHSRAVMQIKGPLAREVLKKGCPINLNELEKNNCAGSVFHGINLVIDCVDRDFQTFNLLTLRSFGESLYHHVTDASLEFGYLGK
jgi:heterotetrameric sarcosine oxidase gamma subunit